MEAEGIHSSKRPRCDKDAPEAEVKGAGGVLPWQNASSRIIRVSRVSGGKDRHSKVLTVKGLRDRRVRLSVSTSIQFYDLQDRLGYDQPSKAVDWLIKAAAAAIVDLPELEGPFPVLSSLALPGRTILSKRPAAGGQHLSQSMSTGERFVKENEKDYKNVNKENSFSELLTAGDNCNGGVAEAAVVNFSNSSDPKQLRPLPAGSTSNYFRQAGIFGHSPIIPQLEPSYYSLLHYGSNPHMGMGMGMMTYNAVASGEHQDIHQFSFMQDHANPVASAVPGGDANHNVSISSGFAGLSRGTLQSNSALQHHLVHGANLPFFFSATLPITTVAGSSSENQFPGDFNGRLQLFCNDARSLPGLKQERKG